MRYKFLTFFTFFLIFFLFPANFSYAGDLEVCQDAGYTSVGECNQGYCINRFGNIYSQECAGCIANPKTQVCCTKFEAPSNPPNPIEKTITTCIDSNLINFLYGTTSTLDEVITESKPVDFVPQVTIPGSIDVGGKTFTINQGQGITVDGSLLSKYIALLFNWLIGAIGVVTVAYLAFGGMQWLAAAGNASGINKAKETIRDSLIGMLLVAGSYTMLYVINPNLVGFKTLVVSNIDAVKLYGGENSDTGVANVLSNGNYFKQCDPAWGNNPYDDGGSGCTICSSGCGITSLAIVLASLGLNETPATVAEYAIQIGARRDCGKTGQVGTSMLTLVSSPKSNWGVQSRSYSNFDEAMQLLDQKKWLITSIKNYPCKSGTCFTGGHLIVLTGKVGDNISIMDPSRVNLSSLTIDELKEYNSYKPGYLFYRFWK